uniref:Uncharacterized protein n=1 Tax=Lymantria dispar multicapsid nuclear polyhedrosis virus TaxID=10449 RepID=A0A7S8F8N6_NPVLD|nr:hypothetical protein [Lymantria dispar multiple nucleopolyhedrovirus]QPD01980.1 hypothetical protein [Lymantria dispar multiple nucleopolyhedrovirus]
MKRLYNYNLFILQRPIGSNKYNIYSRPMKRLYNYNLFILQAQTNTTFIIYNIILYFTTPDRLEQIQHFTTPIRLNKQMRPIGTNKK